MIIKGYEATCDECGCVEHPPVNSVKAVQSYLRERNWYVGRDKYLLCPDCARLKESEGE